jgi:3'(2'), 5'-bisphosphate nucleotidase
MNQFLIDALEAARLASVEILKIYHSAFTYESKEDTSPVTEADRIADDLIKSYLKERYPDFGFLTEESSDDFTRLHKPYVWLVDPIDGTKDFIAKNDEFTINIALVHNQIVIVGVIMIPATGEFYYAIKGEGSFYQNGEKVQRIRVNEKTEGLTVLTSRFHVQPHELDMIEKHKAKLTRVETYGSALKACRIAHGLAEISYRLSPGTKEWDTASSDLIVTEAGGYFLKPNKEAYRYNRQDVRNLEGYLIVNRMENFLL